MPRLQVELYDSPTDKSPMRTLPIDSQQQIDLNKYDVADKVARIRVTTGNGYVTGDHLLLLDNVTSGDTNTIAIDPSIRKDVDLNRVIFNDRGFADVAAAIQPVFSPKAGGRYRLRIRLYDTVPAPLDLPSLVYYDWGGEPLLKKSHFQGKTAKVVIDYGPDYVPGDRVVFRDLLGANVLSFPQADEINGVSVVPNSQQVVNLNTLGWSDKIGSAKFELCPATRPRWPTKVELYEGVQFKMALRGSTRGSLDKVPGYHGHADKAIIHGPKGSVVTFLDDQDYRMGENAVRITKLVDGPITVPISVNFVNTEEERGDGNYAGKDPAGQYEWELFKRVQKDWWAKNLPFMGDVVKKARESLSDELKKSGTTGKIVDGVMWVLTLGIGKRTSNNYHVDDCSSVYFG